MTGLQYIATNSLENNGEEAGFMHKIVLLRENGQDEFFISSWRPTVKYKRNHVEIRGTDKKRRTSFILIVSQRDSAKIEPTN